MAKLRAKLTISGDFRKMVRKLGQSEKIFYGKKVQAAQKNLANSAKGFIRGGIENQRAEWKNLHPLTVAIKGGEEILYETGAFFRAMKAWKEGNSWMAGLYPDSKGRKGQDHEMVGDDHENGVTVAVTPAMRRFFAAKGFPLRADTKFISVPPRKWFEPAMKELEEYAPQVLDPLVEEIMKEIA